MFLFYFLIFPFLPFLINMYIQLVWSPKTTYISSGPLKMLIGDLTIILKSKLSSVIYVMWCFLHFLFRQWNCRDCNSMLKLIEQSSELIPSDIINHVLENMILPQIQLGVEQWDPLTDLVPIHLWIHPWLPYLSESSSILINNYKNKILY